MKNIKKDTWVDMEDVLGHQIAKEHNLPFLRFEQLIKLGEHTVRVYNLDYKAKKITFDEMCTYIQKFISTAFGKQFLKKLK